MTRSCTHCGLPVARWVRALEADEPAFCCTGCHVAFHLSGEREADGPGRFLARVLLSAFLSMGVMVFSLALYGEFLHGGSDAEAAQALKGLFRLGALALSTIVVVLLGMPLSQAVVALRRWLSTDAIILAGALSAWGISCWNTFRGQGEVYFETATMVLLLYSLGRYLDSRARERAHSRLVVALEETPADLERLFGTESETIHADDLAVGDVIRLRPGDVLSFDGRVESGRSFVDCSALTGESVQRSVGPGDRVLSGSRLEDGTLTVMVEERSGSRVQDEIASALGDALNQRAELTLLADRFAAVLLPLVSVLALWTGVRTYLDQGFEAAILAALTVVLISCPCALGVATPLAFWVALGEAWKRGILVRGGEVLERLAGAKRVLLDKTGTLTQRELEIAGIESEQPDEEVLRIAAALEQGSEHPLGQSIRRAWRELNRDGEDLEVRDFRALPGRGVEARLDGEFHSLERSSRGREGCTSVDLKRGDARVASIHLRSTLVEGVPAMLESLRRADLPPAVLTGDSTAAGEALGRELGIPVQSELLPGDKVRAVEQPGTVFVGDGLNDAAALAAAEVGVTVAGSVSSSTALADVNLLSAGIDELPWVVQLSRRAVRVARMNLFWACAYNAIGLFLAVQGKLTPVIAAAAMVLSSVLVVLNSSRLVKGEESRSEEDPGDLRTSTEGLLAHSGLK